MKRKQFTFYRSFFDAMQKLPEEMWLAYLVNVVSYGLDGETAMKMNFTQEAMFELVKPNLDTSRKRAAAGKAGHFVETSCSNKIEGEKENKNKNKNETETNCGKGEDALGLGSVWLGFERFWNLYPVKIGKEEAWEVWQRLCPDEAAACDNLERWMRTGQWRKENGRYIPRAARFLELGQHLQKPEAGLPMGASGKLGKAELEALEQLMRKDLT